MSDSLDPKTKVTSIFFEEETPPVYKRLWFWLVVVALIVIVVGGYFIYQSGALSVAPKDIISPLAS
ncbi:MAG: hypothetical protein NT141_04140 [candidate division WWE3 bacterium]|nr:hypothetical protein [candidate division WWE3 bacterium]